MSVTTPAPVYPELPTKIACPVCFHERDVSARQLRRIRLGEHDPRCYWCRTGRKRLQPDRYLRYWLVWAGVSLPVGMDPREYVAEFGVPEMVIDLAALLWPDSTQHPTTL